MGVVEVVVVVIVVVVLVEVVVVVGGASKPGDTFNQYSGGLNSITRETGGRVTLRWCEEMAAYKRTCRRERTEAMDEDGARLRGEDEEGGEEGKEEEEDEGRGQLSEGVRAGQRRTVEWYVPGLLLRVMPAGFIVCNSMDTRRKSLLKSASKKGDEGPNRSYAETALSTSADAGRE